MSRRAIKEPTRCAGECGRYVRPSETSSEQWPGTMRWRANGMCEPCWRVANHRAKPRFRACAECGCMTRPKSIPATEAPDTRVRDGEVCRPCKEAGGTVTTARVEYIRRELAAYFRSRGRTMTELQEAV